jgi:peptidyl-prolyl cis-trans isomerase SurA
VLKRRARRIAVSGFLLAVAVSGLTACRTSPSVAAYIGDEQVTVTELEAAVEERTADEEVAAFAAGDEGQFTRQVLNVLVQERVHTVAAEQFGVEVSDSQVRSRIDELLGEDDPDTVYSQLAQQGVSRADVFETVRQQLLRREIAVAQGEVQEPSEEELQAQYEEVREGQAQVRFGYITVPDQATADTVAAAVEADPARYGALAQQYAGPYTLPELENRGLEEVPGPLVEQVQAARPNTAFTLPVAEVEGVIVAFVEGTVYPSFEEVRPQLEQQFSEAAEAAGTELVNGVREDLDVVVNPRYGVLEDTGELVPGGGGVVEILQDEGAAGADQSADDGAAGGADGGDAE